MSAKKFRFVSPGIQIREIDKSKLPKAPLGVGPVVVGRTLRGPGMVPVTVSSYEEFVEKFGLPDRGAGSSDVWRNGNTTSPTYGAYAAEAFLKNSGPLTMVRLLGVQDSSPDLSSDGSQAGWSTKNVVADPDPELNGGAYGLFIIPSSSVMTNVTGTLAAVLYLDEGSVALKGKLPGGSTDVTESSALIQNIGSSYEFKILIKDKIGTTVKETSFNFNKKSSKYIRKVLNTNPTLTNADINKADAVLNYWLGETFETNLKEVVGQTTGDTAGAVYGLLAPLQNGSLNLGDHSGKKSEPAKSGWVIGQDLNGDNSSFEPSQMPKLFRLVVGESDTGSDWEQGNVKVSISDIKPSLNPYNKYGTFTVSIRRIEDTDVAQKKLEVFTNCSLDPSSPNFIAAKIGDRRLEWDPVARRHIELGDYPNVSKYVRVELSDALQQGVLEPELLPFGFMGPPRPKKLVLSEASSNVAGMIKLGNAYDPEATSATIETGNIASLGAEIVFPSLKLRRDVLEAASLDRKLVHFGVVSTDSTLAVVNEDYRDLVRSLASDLDSFDADGTNTESSILFSLDDVIVDGGLSTGTTVTYLEGARKAGLSFTSLKAGDDNWLSGEAVALTSDNDYKSILAAGHDKFTMPLFGGTDGLDVKEREPFRNTLTNGKSEKSSYAVASLHAAIDSVREPEVLDMNLLVLPGITNPDITKRVIDVCEERADCLAIIDVEGGYVPASENADSESSRVGSSAGTVEALKLRELNSSYACCYYPWVKVNDTETGAPVWMPPSVVALGTMGSSQEASEVWFAPAGFNRGGLSLGSSGLNVVGVRDKLTSKQRDSLYEVGVNPIASFPSEGIVIFGQKTLQAVPSALDRINVRRMVLFVRKQISRVAANVLFEQNVSATWNRFKGEAIPVLESVKQGLGISEYRLVLDETTTTAEEIDRNMMYAKLFIKPVYAIEFIGIDFVITNTGASFDDL